MASARRLFQHTAMAGTTQRSWLTAVAVCAALFVVPLLAWLLIPEPKPPSVPPPTVINAPRRPTPTVAPEDSAEPSDGARLLLGTVTGENDAPINNAEIFIDGYGRLRTFSDRDGKYRLRAVPLDDLELTVRADGHLEQRLDLGEGEPGQQQQLDIQLIPAPDVAGKVLDPKGEPLARATVSCADGKDPGLVTVSRDDGSFKLSARAAGCKAIATHLKYGDSPPTVLRAGTDNQLQLSSGASISGVVVDAEGHPLQRYGIAVESFKPSDGESRMGRTNTRQQVDDREGRFELTGLQPGQYVLTVQADGFPPTHSDNLDLAAGERLRGVRISLEKGGALTGLVTDATSGEPIAGAAIALDISSMAGRSQRTRSDVNGRYLLDGLPTTAFSLRISAPGYNGRILSALTTTPGRASQQDISLNKLGDGQEQATEYSGIGAQLAMGPDGVIVGRVFNGGPAAEAGLGMGDVLLLIDGADASTFTVGQAVERIRGPAGTRISLTIRRRSGERASLVIERGSVTR